MRRTLFPFFLAPLLIAERQPPADPVTLQSPKMQVIFDRTDGLPVEYRVAGARMRGEDSGTAISATIFQASPRSFRKIPIRPAKVKSTTSFADFSFDTLAAAFVVRYELSGSTLRVSLEDVKEKPGFELIDVALPELATVREADGAAWLAHGDGGGSLIELAKAKPGKLAENRFWGGVAGTLPVVMIGTDKLLCVEEVNAFMDTTELSVHDHLAALGSVKTYRVNGSLSQDMNLGPIDGKPAPRVNGNDRTPNLLVGQRSLCTLDFIGDFDGNGTVDWMDGAKLVRTRMPQIPTHYYDDKFMYSIHVDEPAYAKPGATFAQSEEIVKKIASLTGGNPQNVYLWGWQYRGKDTGYPAVDKINERLGTFDDLKRLIENARKINATVSFSNNFDDAYKSSPAWDPAIIARRPDGELWKSRNWTGEDSYIIGLAKYMTGPGPERIRYTCEHYPLRDTYLVDVLSYYAIRNDWDPEHPASGVKNFDARMKVLEGFKKCGLDLVSEELRYPFIGKLAVADNGPSGEVSPFGGTDIPLVATIYRKSAIWGLRGNVKRANPVLHTLFFNGHGFPWITAETNPDEFVSLFYESIVPWYLTHYRNIESFRREGDRTVIGLEGNSRIDIDWNASKYSVVIEGAEVAKDGDTFCPVGKDRIAFYSPQAKELSASLPREWDPKKMRAYALFANRKEPVEFRVRDAKVTLAVTARRPVMLFRSEIK